MLKRASIGLFGRLLVALLPPPADAWMARYDFLRWQASSSASPVVLPPETIGQARVTLLFHLAATFMSLFKSALARAPSRSIAATWSCGAVHRFDARGDRQLHRAGATTVGFPLHPLSTELPCGVLAAAICLGCGTHRYLPDMRL